MSYVLCSKNCISWKPKFIAIVGLLHLGWMGICVGANDTRAIDTVFDTPSSSKVIVLVEISLILNGTTFGDNSLLDKAGANRSSTEDHWLVTSVHLKSGMTRFCFVANLLVSVVFVTLLRGLYLIFGGLANCSYVV